MLQTIELASKAKGITYHNTIVGCIIVRDNKIITTSYYHYECSDYAKIIALKQC